ncbi:MAG: single-stranded DNA-binding protein [Oscillospiraceae bacterium]|nr:single-stranded DNA-binding protein [Oscillospiraceae bacterium]
MDESYENNRARLVGALAGRPVLSHETRGERFYRLPLAVRRKSGAVDEINVLVRQSQLEALELREEDRLCAEGELRSFNNRRGEGAKLVISLLARRLSFSAEEDANEIVLVGALCKPPTLRRTPLGREVCDLMLAVNRRTGRSDYLPCICWGQRAREAALWDTGARLRLIGRIQSRRYLKVTEEGTLEKTAFEVSASELELLG